MTPVRGFFVANLLGETDATVKVAQAGQGEYPVGSLVQLVPGEAMIDAVAFMGGIEVRVPRDWHVVIRGIPFMGGITDETEAPGEETGKRLVVNAFAMMGGVEIKN